MTAEVLPFHGALRARLVGSRTAGTDLIILAGTIDERICDLRRISRSIGFISADGKTPGEFTIASIELVASSLLQTAQAYRLAAGLPLPAVVELPADCERSDG